MTLHQNISTQSHFSFVNIKALALALCKISRAYTLHFIYLSIYTEQII